jgi:phosphoribosylformimino-5-aminoimidazole carboxamide ribotide isomerase
MAFTIFPAIDLRHGQVVRLQEGDPLRQTTYSADPAQTAARWLDAGASWLHVVNLDGAFDQPDAVNRQALESILRVAGQYNAQVQFGGGLRTAEAVQAALQTGVSRVVLGTLAIEDPSVVAELVKKWTGERIAASLDARNGVAQVHGWQDSASLPVSQAVASLKKIGLRWLVFTDIQRDGMQQGLNIAATRLLAAESGLNVIAAGGVAGLEDVLLACAAKVAGLIIGKALYEGKIDLAKLLKEMPC